ncbi:unnamed protein product [Clonostachys rosea]|uniref:Uncharacterized protein n=1 Tax=Bionectria ochroleuca TaxID=29856 RepID=A0ABY6URH9_BIOOC|nr:unnamed protein product [Clonostachys rosea]
MLFLNKVIIGLVAFAVGEAAAGTRRCRTRTKSLSVTVTTHAESMRSTIPSSVRTPGSPVSESFATSMLIESSVSENTSLPPTASTSGAQSSSVSTTPTPNTSIQSTTENTMPSSSVEPTTQTTQSTENSTPDASIQSTTESNRSSTSNQPVGSSTADASTQSTAESHHIEYIGSVDNRYYRAGYISPDDTKFHIRCVHPIGVGKHYTKCINFVVYI